MFSAAGICRAGVETHARGDHGIDRVQFAEPDAAFFDLFLQVLAHGHAGDVFHDEEEQAGFFIDVNDANEMRRTDFGRDLRFTEEALDHSGILRGQMKREHLDCDFAAQTGMNAVIHRAHAALAKLV
jgi:hypothetical protein